MPIPDPYIESPKSFLLHFISPSSIGTLTAATFAVYPKAAEKALCWKTLELQSLAEKWDVLGYVPGRMYGVLLGFALGYAMVKSLQLVRWRLLKRLLSYRGWVYCPGSSKSKLWGILVKILEWPGPHPTYAFQQFLPKQPLPDLDATLDRWLDVSCHFVTKDEHELTVEAVEEFRKYEGPKLQKCLEEKAKETVNWVSDYWLQAAYLSSREPIAVNSNYYNTHAFPESIIKDPVKRMAVIARLMGEFHAKLLKQSLPPVMTNGIVPLCMQGFKYLFNTNRNPGEHMDSIVRYPKETHVVVIRDGHFYKLDMYAPDSKGKRTLLTAEEVYAQLQIMCADAEASGEATNVAALTTQNRTTWAKQREMLKELNSSELYAVESAMFLLCLDSQIPKDITEHAKLCLTGMGNNRWFDHCYSTIVFGNAWGGTNVEHSVIDATVLGHKAEHYLLYETLRYPQFKDNAPTRNLKSPEKLQWDITGMEHIVSEAATSYKQVIADLDMCAFKTIYSKGVMKKFKLSPDGYIQMALQLAYYRCHKQFVKTYEPATGRLYALGRTETIHPMSQHSVTWVKTMDDWVTPRENKASELRAAIKHQASFRLQATMGNGCDRHLLALYCASCELGMDVPALFRDKAWQVPFKLSTSQTPTKVCEIGSKVDPYSCSGGFGPSCHGGYGVSYIILSDEICMIHVTSWKSYEETDSKMFANAVNQALEDMKELLST